MKVPHTDDGSSFVNHYDSDALHEILDTHHKITEYIKKKNFNKLFQILIINDHFAYDPSFTRQ